MTKDKVRKPKKLRGKAKNEASKYRETPLRVLRVKNQMKRVGVCAVCGIPPVKDLEGNDPPKMSWRTTGCWRFMACDRHETVIATVTLDGKLRFHEVHSCTETEEPAKACLGDSNG